MKHFLLFFVCLMLISGSSLYSQDRLNVKSKQLYSTYPEDSPALLLDQNTLPTAQSIVSNDLRGRHPDSSLVQCADNFTVPGGMQWTIDSIAFTGTYSVATNMDSIVVAIYSDVAGAPGTTPIMVRTTRPVLGITTGTNMAVKFSSPLVVPAGNYWVSIYAVYNTASTLAQGRWNWSTSTTATGLNCHIRDYTGLFGIPPFPWTPTTTLVPGELSHLFSLFGTSGPPSAPSALCFSRSGLGLAIPDNSPVGVTDTIKVPNNSGDIDDITVVIDNIAHTWVGDLIARLHHEGETDTLFSRIGTGGNGNSTDNLTGIRFTDSASVAINSLLVNTTPVAPGNYLPGGRTGVDSLKKPFVRPGGAPSEMNGNWVLWVNDNAGLDLGTLNAWSICFYSDNITQIISNSSETPDRYTLGQNYPNPFNPTTQINFQIPKAGLVSLKVYDMLGREVSSLVNRQLNAGTFTAEFDGAGLSSGTYFYRLQVNDFVEIKKMVLLK